MNVLILGGQPCFSWQGGQASVGSSDLCSHHQCPKWLGAAWLGSCFLSSALEDLVALQSGGSCKFSQIPENTGLASRGYGVSAIAGIDKSRCLLSAGWIIHWASMAFPCWRTGLLLGQKELELRLLLLSRQISKERGKESASIQQIYA